MSRLPWPWRAGVAFRLRELRRAAVDASKELGHSWVTAVTISATMAGKAISDWLTKDGFGVLELTGIALAALLGTGIGWLVLFALRWLLAGGILAAEDAAAVEEERKKVAVATRPAIKVFIRVGPWVSLEPGRIEATLLVINRARENSVSLRFELSVAGDEAFDRKWETLQFKRWHPPAQVHLAPQAKWGGLGEGQITFNVSSSSLRVPYAELPKPEAKDVTLMVFDDMSGKSTQLPFPGEKTWVE